MATHKIKADLDVDGEVQGTSLDINGNADISGTLALATLDISGNADIDGTTNLDAVDIDGAVQIDNTLTVGVDDTGYDVKFFGATSGSSFLYDESEDGVVITHPTDETGLGIYTNSGGQPTVPQLQIGRSTAQYWGAYTDDRIARLVHRQDETSGALSTYFEQWDSNTSDTTGNWLWRFGDGSGGNMATALTLTQGGDLTLVGDIYHSGDSDTKIGFSAANTFQVQTGGSARLTINDSKALFAAEVEAGSLDINGNADISGNLTVSGTFLTLNGEYPRIKLTDSNNNDDYDIINNNGTFIIYNDTDSSIALAIAGDNNATFAGNVTLSGIILDGNTITGVDDSGEFTNDDAHIMTSAAIEDKILGYSYTANGLPTTGGTMSGAIAMGNQNITGAGTITGTTLTGTSLDINGDADISGDLGGLDKITSSVYIIGGHTINDIDRAGEFVDSSEHILTSAAANDRFAQINADTTGTAAIATTITVADESSDTSCNVLFATAATGNLGPKSGTNLTFNSSSGVLTATGFAGALTGNVTGNASGSSGSCTGNSATATALTSGDKTISGNVTINGFVLDGNTITGIDDSGEFTDNDSHIMTSAGINDKFAVINANTTGSSGSCTGNAATATEATNITATANNSANETVYLTFVDGATGTQGIETDTGLSYNPSTGNLTTNILNVGGGITHDGDINNKISFGTDTQTFSCDGNDALIIRGNAVTDAPLFEITGAGAGNSLNIGLLLKGNANGNPIKMKMQAPPAGGGSAVGAGILSYEPDTDTFNIGQDTSHGSMAISINDDDIATFTNAATLSGGFVLDGNTITGVDNASEFTDDDNHIMTSTAIKNKIADNDNSFMLVSTTTTQTGTKTFSGVIDITNTTDSSNATGDTGALRCEGGGSIAKKLYVGSTITGSADVIAFSDKKLKENIETLDGKKVLDMRGVSFTRKDTGAESSGVIAQEIQKVAPELVHDTEGTLGVAYGNLVGYLIEAVKDQQKQINELKEIINGSSR